MKDSKIIPELAQSEPLQQTLYLHSLSEWWRAGQHPDFTLIEQEWQHALCEWKPANWPRCLHDNYFDDCSTCLTHRQITDKIQ